MAGIPKSIRSALALHQASEPERIARVEAAFPGPGTGASPVPRRRYYAELERGGELYTLPVLAASLEEAENQAKIHCRGRGYRFERVDPEWDAEEVAGKLMLRAELASRPGASDGHLPPLRCGCGSTLSEDG
jgi:hypothetical protein